MSTPMLPERPPRSLTIEERLKELESIPLFMKSLPEEETDDPMISALQNLAHEGTPDEVAQNFKDQGNDYFKGKRYREAQGFYTQAIDAKPTDPVLQEAILCNRAACNLELKNYGQVLRDCSKALTLNPKSSKAYYRSALALLALERAEEALDCCDRCLLFDADNKGVQNERNLIAVSRKDASQNDFAPHFDPDDPTDSTLILPVFFLYPQYATSDVIPEFVEDTAFAAHLAVIFPPQANPPEWDAKGEYVDGKLVVYAMTHRKRLLKVGKKMTLRDTGSRRTGWKSKTGCLSFVVVPKGEVETKWVEEYKSSR
ncbi:hypothetical protein FB45DRAFT_976662 [Roridomyces roridus]|uniref:Cns1/TTC4 wheel domain-containing protein n=1 Tax=Roridomyces roridus TaxID=1738132 RepID=A0AAD7C3X6_9AGAR|nr:hypothetical protein FB45DRAFT_976662 [Roridomyces roridus]